MLPPLLKNPDQQWKIAAANFFSILRPTSDMNGIPNEPAFPPSSDGKAVMGYIIRVDEY